MMSLPPTGASDKSRRVALYARVSTELQEREQTIESQLVALRQYAQQQGDTITTEYRDEGYSGATLARPALDRLRDAVREGSLDLVLFHSPDRLARKALLQGLLLEELEQAGVAVAFLNHPVDDSPEGKMLLGMQGLFAEYERAKIAERNRRGKLHWARQGALMGGYVPYGYRRVPRDRAGNQRATLAVDDAQAAVVREVFRLLVEERRSCRGIAQWLTAQGIATQTGQQRWYASTVNHLLKAEVYRGVFYYQRTAAAALAPASRTPPRTIRWQRPPEEWIAIPVPAIIAAATWAAAQRQLEENFRHSSRHNTQHPYLLRGLLRCARCGGACAGSYSHGRRSYRCLRNDALVTQTGVRCPAGRVPAEPLEAVVWEALRELFQQPEVLLAEYRRRSASEGEASGVGEARRQQERALRRVEVQQERLTDAYLQGVLELAEYAAKREALREQQRQLERQRRDLEQRAAAQVQAQDALARLEAFCQAVAAGLDTLTFAGQQALLRLVVERITVEEHTVRIETVIPLGERFSGSVALRPTCFQTRQ